MIYNIAIDGPAGAGKSTIAKRVAKNLGFIYVDTGAMYRAMAVYFLDKGIDVKDEDAVSKDCDNVNIMIEYKDNLQQVILNGENITSRLRTEEVANTASAVRKKLVELQKELAKKTSVGMDGRDIGSCVLKDAICKIYLTASVECRALRRMAELQEKGVDTSLEIIKADISDRDYRDMHRDVSPLVQAEDAVYLDSSDMGIEEVTDKIISIFNEKAGK